MEEFLNDENSLFDRNTIIEKAMVGKFYFFKCEDCGNISSKMIRFQNLLKENNVKIISDCSKYIEYSKEKYGPNVFEIYKIH